MKLHRVAEQYQPSVSDWNRMLATIPRENSEESLFDLTYENGVLSGLEVTQQAVPNLSVKIAKGRAVFRNASTGRATVMELSADATLSLAGSLPVGSPSTVLVVLEPNLETSESVTPPGAPLGVATGQQIILGSVTLSAAQTQILNSHISSTQRQSASPAKKILALEAQIQSLVDDVVQIGTVEEFIGTLAQMNPKNILLDGTTKSRATYPDLFALWGVSFGVGNGVDTFGTPNLMGRFMVGAGTAYNVGDTGGSDSVGLNLNQIPSHDHDITVQTGGAHTHTAEGGLEGAHTHTGATSSGEGTHSHYLRGDGSSGSSGYWAPVLIQSADWNDYAGGPTGGSPPTHGTNPANSSPLLAPGSSKDAVPAVGSDHTHTLTTSVAGSHTHTLTVDGVLGHAHTASSSSEGGGQTHENRPPYFGVLITVRAKK
jgi:microcystin-dependent protein